jgi:hypothetical protein
MNTHLKRLVVIGGAVVAGALLLALTASLALAQGPRGAGPGYGHGMMGGWGQGYGPGTMHGWGGNGMMGGWGPGSGVSGSPAISDTQPYGPGMMGGWGQGYGHGMMGGWGYGNPGTGERLTLDQATDAVNAYLAASGNSDLTLAEVMEFSQNFYAEVEESSTGIHAFELLVDPYTGAVGPEPGPNMMWNIKYGHMGGWWGNGSQGSGANMAVSPEQARQYAQQYLDSYMPGTSAASQAEPFYGYYTLHVLKSDQIVGMLSVNGTTGQVWYHNWHGDFIRMTEAHDSDTV